METVVNELAQIVESYSKKFRSIPEQDFSRKPLPHKWSGKEVVGHLVDSGQNNLRRFITGQYESTPPKITYEQDHWVKSNDYQSQPAGDIIALWSLINRQICSVLKTMPKSCYSREADTGHGEVQLHTLEWLAKDYVRHMKHHINQVIPGSFDVKYP